MARIDLPSQIARGLFFVLCRIGGVHRGPIRHYGHHGERGSVFERHVPRVLCNVADGHGHGSVGHIFDSVAHSLRTGPVCGRRWSLIRNGHHASPCHLHLQSQPPSPRLGVDGASPSNATPLAVEALAPPVVEAPALPAVEDPVVPVDEVVAEPIVVPTYVPKEPMSPAPAPPRY